MGGASKCFPSSSPLSIHPSLPPSLQGPTHRLEIHPPGTGEGGPNSTVLRMSDLNAGDSLESTDIVVEQEDSAYDRKLDVLENQMGVLQAEVKPPL